MSVTGQLVDLARGWSGDPGIGVSVGEVDWCYCPETNVIHVPERDLLGRGPVYCRRVMAHEVAHRRISRYYIFEWDSCPLPEDIAQALQNACEDPRVDAWIGGRYGGMGQTIRRMDAEFVPCLLEPQHPLFSAVAIEQFVVGCAVDTPWLDPELRECIPWTGLVGEALDATRDARHEMTRLVPPMRANERPDAWGQDLVQAYAQEVLPLLPMMQTPRPLPLAEQSLRLLAARAHRILVTEIAPVARDLYVEDGQPTELTLPDLILRRLPSYTPCNPDPTANLDPDLDLDLEGGNRHTLISAQLSAPLTIPTSEPLELYSQIVQRLRAPMERLASLLRQRLESASAPTWQAGQRSGPRLHLRSAMSGTQDPHRRARPFARRRLPQDPDAATLILIDLSGSMHGPKSLCARDAAILCAEVLQAFGCPLAVYGFQDELIPFVGFGQSLDAQTRETLTQMHLEACGERKGGHNCPWSNDDAPCLEEAAAILRQQEARQHLLISISDGQPAGPRSTPEELYQVCHELGDPTHSDLTLVGLGVGPQTECVETFYPVGRGNIPPQELPEILSQLISQATIGAPPRLR